MVYKVYTRKYVFKEILLGENGILMVTISCQWIDIELLGLIFLIDNLFYTAVYLVFAYTYVVGHISGNLFYTSL